MDEQPIIQIKDVHKYFSDSIHALRGVTLDIYKGEVITCYRT